jgi:hypothetical protein
MWNAPNHHLILYEDQDEDCVSASENTPFLEQVVLASEGSDVSNVTPVSEVPYRGTSTASSPLSRSPPIVVCTHAAHCTRQHTHVYIP